MKHNVKCNKNFRLYLLSFPLELHNRSLSQIVTVTLRDRDRVHPTLFTVSYYNQQVSDVQKFQNQSFIA